MATHHKSRWLQSIKEGLIYCISYGLLYFIGYLVASAVKVNLTGIFSRISLILLPFIFVFLYVKTSKKSIQKFNALVISGLFVLLQVLIVFLDSASREYILNMFPETLANIIIIALLLLVAFCVTGFIIFILNYFLMKGANVWACSRFKIKNEF